MLKKIAQLILILTFLSSAFIVINQSTVHAATTGPANLKIFIGPSSVLADNNTYKCIFVQLQDSSAKPARALQDTTISLSSSLTNIGTVDSSITIAAGATYASANFCSTFSPGTTSITASATGYATVQSPITTVGPIPSSVAIYGFPSTLPADGNTYSAIMVQLQDSVGSPAKAPKGGVPVTLSCSDTLYVGNVTQNIVIPEGKTFATANFTTRFNSTKVQSAFITTVSQGYTSQQLTITTTPIASNPSSIKIFVGTPQVPADQNACPQIAIELQNATGFASTFPSNTTISVASSDPTIGQIDSEIIVPANQTYGVATLNSTYKAGTTTITAVGTNLLRGQQAIATTGFTPSKLAVYCAPSSLPSDRACYQSIQVQLQDSQGRPAKDPQTDVNVNLFSSQPTVGTVVSTLTIPFGQTQATGNITVTNTAGSTTITAQASSYTTGQGTTTTYLIDFAPTQISAAANPTNINNGQKTIVSVYLTADNAPVAAATIQFTSDNGGAFTAVSDQGNGSYTSTFTAPSFTQATICTITASATKTGYVTSQATAQVTVQPPPAATPAPTLTPTATPTPTSTPHPSATPISSTTPNSTSTGLSAGTIQMRIGDSDGNALINATVSATQPSGQVISGTTNASGYVTFTNVTAGNYTFHIVKDGYEQLEKPITFNGQPVKTALALSNDTSAPASDIPWTIIIVVIVVVAFVIIIVIVLKRKRSRVVPLNNPASFRLSQIK